MAGKKRKEWRGGRGEKDPYLHLPESLLSLSFCLCVDEISEALHLCKVQFPIQKCSG